MNKKCIFGFAIALSVALVLTGCNSTPANPASTPVATQATIQPAPTPAKKTPSVTREMIDWKGASIGQEVPSWVIAAVDNDVETLQDLPEFKDSTLFFAESQGENIDLLKSWANNFQVQAEFSKTIKNFVISKFGAELNGSKDDKEAQSFLTETVASFSKAEITGLRKAKDYWVQTRYTDNNKGTFEDKYQYFVIYSIKTKNLETQIDKVLGGVAAETAKQQQLKNEVRSLVLEAQVYSEIAEDEAKAAAESSAQ